MRILYLSALISVQITKTKSIDLIPVSKEGNPPPKGGNPLKAEKNGPVPRFLLPR